MELCFAVSVESLLCICVLAYFRYSNHKCQILLHHCALCQQLSGSHCWLQFSPSPPVAYPELLRYQGTHTPSQCNSYIFCAFLVLNSSQNHVYSWQVRSFTRAQTNYTRACALVQLCHCSPPQPPSLSLPSLSFTCSLSLSLSHTHTHAHTHTHTHTHTLVHSLSLSPSLPPSPVAVHIPQKQGRNSLLPRNV